MSPPEYVYRCLFCGAETVLFKHTFAESKAFIECGCGRESGRVITGDNRVWAPKLTSRLKKIFAKEKNRQYAESQKQFPNRSKTYTAKRKSK